MEFISQTSAKEYSSDFHLNTIKTTIDYLHNSRNKHNSEKHDELIHDLTKVVRLIKGLYPKDISN